MKFFTDLIHLNISPQRAAQYLRITYLIWLVAGIFSLMYVPATLVTTDAATTFNNIANNQQLFRLGIVGSLFIQLIQIVAAVLLYKLFKNVSRNHSFAMAFLAIIAVPIAMLAVASNVVVATMVSNAEYLQAFSTDQIHGLVMLFLELSSQGVLIASIFWGLWLFPLGYLVYKSRYFPKFIGWALVLGGIGYLIDSFVHLLIADLGSSAELVENLVMALTMGELVFVLWLMILGPKLSNLNYLKVNRKK